MNIRLIRRWATQIFDAVFSLHARGLFRLDLRPENILLEPVSGDVVLTYKCAWACVHKPIICDQAYTAPGKIGYLDTFVLFVLIRGVLRFSKAQMKSNKEVHK